MNEQNGIRMTYRNLLATIVIAVGMFGGLATVASATATNAAEIQHEKELAEQDRKHIKDTLKRMESLLNILAEKVQ